MPEEKKEIPAVSSTEIAAVSAAEGAAKDSTVKKRKEKAPVPKQNIVRPAIVVADAEAADVALIKQIANEENCDVFAAADMDELMSALDRLQPLLIFVERNLPKLNFSMLCRRAQQRRVGVVLQGYFQSPNELIALVKLGVIDVMTKPLNHEVILRKILQALAYVKQVWKRELAAPAAGAATETEDIATRLKHVLEASREIMAMPQVAARLIALCDEADANVEEMAKTAGSDPALSLMLLRRANSVAYGQMTQTKSLRDAIVRIGSRTVRSIVAITSVFKMSLAHAKSGGFNRVGHWLHSLSVGTLAEALAGNINFPAPENVFLAGVLHDFGKLVLDDHLGNEYSKAIRLAEEKNLTIREAELEHFKMAHEAIAYELCRHWRLPETIGEIIRLHHDEKIWQDGDTAVYIPARMVNLADRIARALALGYAGDTIGLPIPANHWDAAGLEQTDLRALSTTVIQRVNEMVQWLGIKTEGASLPNLPLPHDESIWILDGDGTPDHLLDFIAVALGFTARHGQPNTMPDGRPAMMIWDFRRQAHTPSSLQAGWLTEKDKPIFVLAAEKTAADLPAAAQVFPTPLDLLDLSQAMAKAI